MKNFIFQTEKRGSILNNFCIRYRMQISMIDGNSIFEKTPELYSSLWVYCTYVVCRLKWNVQSKLFETFMQFKSQL